MTRAQEYTLGFAGLVVLGLMIWAPAAPWSPEAWAALAAWVMVGVAAAAGYVALGQLNEVARLRREQAQPKRRRLHRIDPDGAVPSGDRAQKLTPQPRRRLC